MNCRRVSSLVSAYIDGELTGVEMLEIRRHLDSCRACVLQYESLRHVKQLLSRLNYAQPRAALVESISRRLDEVEAPSYRRVLSRLWSCSSAHVTPIAASCAALGLVLVLLTSRAINQPGVVALTYPQISVGALGIPSASDSLEPIEVAVARPENSRLVIPEPAPMGPSPPAVFTLASFEGY